MQSSLILLKLGYVLLPHRLCFCWKIPLTQRARKKGPTLSGSASGETWRCSQKETDGNKLTAASSVPVDTSQKIHTALLPGSKICLDTGRPAKRSLHLVNEILRHRLLEFLPCCGLPCDTGTGATVAPTALTH